MSQSSGFTDELDSVLDRDSVSDNDVELHKPATGKPATPADDSGTRQAEDECTHPVIFNSMCATCFKHIEEGPEDSSLAGGAGNSKVDLRYLGLQVSQNHLKEQSEQQERHLLSQKKLVVVFDLDHTLLHTELKSRLLPEAIEQVQRLRHSQQQQPAEAPKQSTTANDTAASEPDQTASASDALPSRKRPRENTTPAQADTLSHPSSTLAQAPSYATVYDNGDSYTKLRPGAFEMLEALRDRCELRIFTMGNPQYACAMASLLDRSGALFRNRIVARDDADAAWRNKGLQKAGAMPALTAIIDDTVDVWRAELANLVRVPRYHFFLPDGRSVADLAADEDPGSGPLATITRLLVDVHTRFFGAAATAVAPPGACSPGDKQGADAAVRAGGGVAEAGAALPLSPPTTAAAPGGDDGPPGNALKQASAAVLPGSGKAEPEDDGRCTRDQSAEGVRGGVDRDASAPGDKDPDKGTENGQTGEGAGPAAGQPQASRQPLEPCDRQGLAQSPPEKNDVRRILEEMRRGILRGCVVVFSRVFDNSMRAAPEQHSLWQLALALGARCAADVDATTTHLVTLSCATDKARTALRQRTALVSPDWLIACECAWARLLEEDFPAPAPEVAYTFWRQNLGAEHVQALKLRGAV